MITSSKHARNRTKQEFWGLDRLQQTEAYYKTDGEERDSFWETPTVFHHHSSTDLSEVSYQSKKSKLFVSLFLLVFLLLCAAYVDHSSSCSEILLLLTRSGHTAQAGRHKPDFWDGGNQHFSETAEGRKSAATANVKINKRFGNPAVLLVPCAAQASYNLKYNCGPFLY